MRNAVRALSCTTLYVLHWNKEAAQLTAMQVSWLDSESESLRAAFKEMRQLGVTTFDALVRYFRQTRRAPIKLTFSQVHAFPPGSRCWTFVDDDRYPQGFIVQNAEVEVGTFRTLFFSQNNVPSGMKLTFSQVRSSLLPVPWFIQTASAM